MHQNSAIHIRCRAGFTLIELLIVMSIAAAVAMIAVPSINLAEMRVNSSARQVALTLLAAQRLAVLRQYSIVVAFDTVNEQVRVHEDRNSNGTIDPGEISNYVKLEEGVAFGRGPVPARPFGGAAITFVKKQGAFPAITFNRSGSAGENGGLYVTSTRALQSAVFTKETRAFEVNRGTGRSVMYTYDGSTWRRSF